jgi:4-hydroxybutyrate dehydrogenase / sulfolactaldehyde 3-reductase
MAQRRVGFIGLGTMGMPMARNVLRGGFPLTVCDVRPEPVAELVQEGAQSAASPREAAEWADVVITMVPDSPDVRQVVFGENGVLEALRPDAVLIEMSTIDPSVTHELAAAVQKRGARMIDAPVGRSSAAAAEGNLIIMAGGDEATIEECRPVLETMGSTIHHCGPVGAGITTKIVNNLVSSSILLTVAEAMVLGVKAGLTPETMVNVLTGTGAGCWQLENTFRNMVFRGDFEPGFKVNLAHKDLGLALNLAREQGVPLLLGGLCRELYQLARIQGKGDLDWGAYTTVLEQLAGVEARYGEGAG